MSGVTGGIRLHRQRSIYSRIHDLIKSGALDYDKRPLWYDVYAAHPPIRKPVYIADPKPDEYGLTEVKDDVRKIFYPEDKIRAVAAVKFRRYNWISSMFPHENHPQRNLTQTFVSQYRELEEKSKDLSPHELFAETEKLFESYFLKEETKQKAMAEAKKAEAAAVKAEAATGADEKNELESDSKS